MKIALKRLARAAQNSGFAPMVNWPVAMCAFSLGATAGLADYRAKGQISRRNWERLLKAHCLTNGRMTALLNVLTRIVRPPRKRRAVSGLLGYFSVERQSEVLRALDQTGIYVFPQLLPKDFCDRVQTFAAKANTVIETNRDLREPLIPYDPSHPVSRTYRIREQDAIINPAIQELLADPVFLAISEAYLNSQPTIGGIDVWWSARYGNEPGSDAAQLFHFDFDAPPAWLKLFVYVTDVGPDNGPHIYVKGSHKPGLAPAKKFLAGGYERISDEDMVAAFGEDALEEITGKQGTVFLADTRGFHKGKMPIAGHRLLAQLIYCPPMFNDHGTKAKLPENHEPSLAAAIARTPAVYERFR